jgi:hypothetical protein
MDDILWLDVDCGDDGPSEWWEPAELKGVK